jgi:hypothetical protein
MQTEPARHRSSSLDALVEAAVCAGTPKPVAEEARCVTERRFARVRDGRTASARATAYFWGVVRNRALRGAAPRLTRSLVAASLVAELVEAGHGPEAVRREVERVYGAPAAGAFLPALAGGGRAA